MLRKSIAGTVIAVVVTIFVLVDEVRVVAPVIVAKLASVNASTVVVVEALVELLFMARNALTPPNPINTTKANKPSAILPSIVFGQNIFRSQDCFGDQQTIRINM